MSRHRPSEADFQAFDDYLEVMFQLLEGIADVPRAQESLSRYLAERSGTERLPPDLEEMLIETFFHKCAKEFTQQCDTSLTESG